MRHSKPFLNTTFGNTAFGNTMSVYMSQYFLVCSRKAYPSLWHGVIVLILCLSSLATAAESFLVIPLQHRPADLMLDQLTPHLTADTSVSSSGNNLILRGDERELAQLKLLVSTLDQPLAQFVIHVRHQQGGTDSTGSIRVNGQVVSNHGNTVSKSSGNTQITTRIISRTTSDAHNSSYQVRATEGYPAFIGTGNQVPITTSTYYGSGSAYSREVNSSYQPIISGVYVTPFLQGDGRVQLNLSTEKNTPAQHYPGQAPDIASSAYAGVINTELDQWINLAGVSLSSTGEGEISSRSLDNQQIEILVQQVQ